MSNRSKVAAWHLGQLYERKNRPKKAVECYLYAINTYDSRDEPPVLEAQMYLANVFKTGSLDLGVDRNLEKALKLYSQAGGDELGHYHFKSDEGKYQKGLLLLDMGKMDGARTSLEAAAKGGHYLAKYHLAVSFLLKNSNEKEDVALGFRYVKEASDQGHLDAHLTLAGLCQSQKTLPQFFDEVLAWELLYPLFIQSGPQLDERKDAKGLILYSLYHLGTRLGKLGEAQLTECLLEAAFLEKREAMHDYGKLCIQKGDFTHASLWLARAAQDGCRESMNAIADMYAAGDQGLESSARHEEYWRRKGLGLGSFL